MTAYNDAVEIAIRACEEGTGPDTWDAWTDEIRFVPAEADAREASAMFGESSEQDTFDEWLATLPDQDFVDMTRAIDTIRRVMRSAWQPLPLPVLAGWLDLD